MASIEDRWYQDKKDAEGNVVLGPNGKPLREPTARHGVGKRWLLRWREPDKRGRKLSFDKKTAAEAKKKEIEGDLVRGKYIDPDAGAVTFGAYATEWLERQASDPLTKEHMTSRFRLHIEPKPLWRTPLHGIRPSTIQAWIKSLPADHAGSTKSVIFTYVSSVLNAAVDDELIGRNPCASSSVRRPRPEVREIEPWPSSWVETLHAKMPDPYRVTVSLGAGLGLRQGEMFGLGEDDIDWDREWVSVRRQVKIVGKRLIFAPPKGGKSRRVPLPSSVRDELREHLAARPAKAVTLPWGSPDGKPTAVRLVVTNRHGGACQRQVFNARTWKPALRKAGIPDDDRLNGMHALRHHYASVLLDGGESIKALAKWLGHASAAFTLKVYAHLMPASEGRTRAAIDALRSTWGAPGVPQEVTKEPVTSA